MTLSSSPLPLPSAVLRHHIDEGSLHTSLKEWHSLKKVPQVLLVTGMVGVGKRSLCHYLAQWILCENTWPTDSEEAGLFGNLMLETEKPTETSQNNLKPCGSCQSCINALKGAWVDFTEIQSEESENDPGNDSGTLKIDQFRKLKSSLGFSGGTGKYRVILIPNADRMTIQAANSVLKLLEEPPAGWIFLLTSSDASLLLPTIVSRCQQLRLKPFSKAVIGELLSLDGPPTTALEASRREICAEMAQGSWGKALNWMEPEAWDKRKILIDFLYDPKSQLNPLVEWSASAPKNMEKMIDQLEVFLMDLIRWSISQLPPQNYTQSNLWINSDAQTPLSAIATKGNSNLTASRNTWIERARRLAKARVELSAPLNRKLLAQDLLMSWLA